MLHCLFFCYGTVCDCITARGPQLSAGAGEGGLAAELSAQPRGGAECRDEAVDGDRRGVHCAESILFQPRPIVYLMSSARICFIYLCCAVLMWDIYICRTRSRRWTAYSSTCVAATSSARICFSFTARYRCSTRTHQTHLDRNHGMLEINSIPNQ